MTSLTPTPNPPDLRHAAQRVTQFVERFGPEAPAYRLLAMHAALPLVLTPDLLNYLRARFLRGQLPWIAEADLLLSDLCRPVGYEQYVLDSDARAYLLAQMKADPALGDARMQDVARLLLHYVRHLAQNNPYLPAHELQAQQWAAMACLDDQRETVVREMIHALYDQMGGDNIASTYQQLELARLLQLMETLALELAQYTELLAYAGNIRHLLEPDTQQTTKDLWRICPSCQYPNGETITTCKICRADLRGICPSCGTVNDVDVHFCKACNYILKIPICKNCGLPLEIGDNFCDSCGFPVDFSPVPSMPLTWVDPLPVTALPDAISVGIWGGVASGKTMYLGMLRINIMRQHQHMWHMMPWNERSSRFIGMVDTALANHRFVEPTITDMPDNLYFQFTRRDVITYRDQIYNLHILDMPGQWYQYPQSAVINGQNVLQEYLTNCQALLCLVDPDSGIQERMNLFLSELLSTLFLKNNRQRIDKWFAFCLTKMDLPAHRDHLHNPEPYVKQKLGNILVDNLQQFCAPGRVRFDFACSAVGFYPGMKPERSNSGIDWKGEAIIYEVDKIQPFGLVEPLEWLLTNIKPYSV